MEKGVANSRSFFYIAVRRGFNEKWILYFLRLVNHI